MPLLLIAVVLSWLVGSLVIADDGEAIERCHTFPVFDATLYSHKPDLSLFGMRPMISIYPDRFWPNRRLDELPSEQRVKHVTEWYVFRRPGQPVFLNVEHWPTNTLRDGVGPEDVLENLGRLASIVRWMHEVEPDLKVGYYGILPTSEYGGPVEGVRWRLEQAETNNRRLLRSDLAKEVDILYPSLYVRYSDDVDDWKTWASWKIDNARRFGKPVYPFVWPQFHKAAPEHLRGKPVPRKFWREILDFCREHADGVVIWGGWDGGRQRWDSTAPWWQETQMFLDALECAPSNSAE